MEAPEIVRILSRHRFRGLHDEKSLQSEIAQVLTPVGLKREFRFDEKSIVDFFLEEEGIAIEVKITGSRRKIFAQLERYASFEQVRTIILVTNRAMGLPEFIKNKPRYVVNLSKAWL